MTLKKHIVVLAVFLLLSAFALSGCVFFADNAIEKLPYAGVANFNPLEGSEPIKVSYFDKISKRVRTKHYSFTEIKVDFADSCFDYHSFVINLHTLYGKILPTVLR